MSAKRSPIKVITALRAGAVHLVGFPHNEDAQDDGYVQIYPSLDDATVYYRVKEDDIVLEVPNPEQKNSDPLTPSNFFIRKGAEIVLSKSVAADEQANFLSGPLGRNLTAAEVLILLDPWRSRGFCVVARAYSSLICPYSKKSQAVAC